MASRKSLCRAVDTGPGTYILVLRCASNRRIRIGHLGMLHLQPGFYLYVGSAFGPGGLRSRIEHHARRAARPHWHIDYLWRHAPEAVWYWPEPECVAVSALPARPSPCADSEARIEVPAHKKCLHDPPPR